MIGPLRHSILVLLGATALLVLHLFLGYGVGLGLAGPTVRDQLVALAVVGAMLTVVGSLEGLAFRAWDLSAKRLATSYAVAGAIYLILLTRLPPDPPGVIGLGVIGLVMAPVAFFVAPGAAALLVCSARRRRQGEPVAPTDVEQGSAKGVGLTSAALGLGAAVALPILAPAAILISGLGWRHMARTPGGSRYQSLTAIGVFLGLVGLVRLIVLVIR